MRSLFRLILLMAAFLGGCYAQNWTAMERCKGAGGTWVKATGDLPGGLCTGLKARG